MGGNMGSRVVTVLLLTSVACSGSPSEPFEPILRFRSETADSGDGTSSDDGATDCVVLGADVADYAAAQEPPCDVVF